MDCSTPRTPPSPSPGVCSDSCPLSWWCYITISSSAAPSLFAFSLSQHQDFFLHWKGLSLDPVNSLILSNTGWIQCHWGSVDLSIIVRLLSPGSHSENPCRLTEWGRCHGGNSGNLPPKVMEGLFEKVILGWDLKDQWPWRPQMEIVRHARKPQKNLEAEVKTENRWPGAVLDNSRPYKPFWKLGFYPESHGKHLKVYTRVWLHLIYVFKRSVWLWKGDHIRMVGWIDLGAIHRESAVPKVSVPTACQGDISE